MSEREWQPIETAPKDGRAVLLASRAHVREIPFGDREGETIHYPSKCHIGKWDAEGMSWTDELGGFENEICTLSVTGIWLSGGGWFQPNEVTHWMPLPAPPPTGSGSGREEVMVFSYYEKCTFGWWHSISTADIFEPTVVNECQWIVPGTLTFETLA